MPTPIYFPFSIYYHLNFSSKPSHPSSQSMRILWSLPCLPIHRLNGQWPTLDLIAWFSDTQVNQAFTSDCTVKLSLLAFFCEAVLKARATWQPPCYHEGWKPGGECAFWEKQSCKKEWGSSWWHYLTPVSCQNSQFSEVISWDICFPGNKVKDTDFLLFCDSMFKFTYFQIRYLTIICVPLWTNVNPFRKKLI